MQEKQAIHALISAANAADFYKLVATYKTLPFTTEEANKIDEAVAQIELQRGFINPLNTELIKKSITGYAKMWDKLSPLDQKQATAQILGLAKTAKIPLTTADIIKMITTESKVGNATKIDTTKKKLLEVTNESYAKDAMTRVLAKYIADEQVWITYDHKQSKWVPNIDGKEVMDSIHVTVANQQKLFSSMPLSENTEAIEKDLKKTKSINFIDGTFKYARTMPEVSIRGDLLNKAMNKLCVKNGQIDLDTLTYEDADPNILSTQSCGVPYIKDATCPKFEETARFIFNNDENYRYFQKAVGYAALGNPNKKVLIFMYGAQGNNGKSLLTGRILKVLGDYGVTIKSEIICTPHGAQESVATNGHDTALMKLQNKRFLNANEPQGQFKNQRIKQMVGDSGAGISAREIGGREQTIHLVGTLFVDSNSLPHIPGNDNATISRIAVLPFERYFIRPSDSDEKVAEETRKGNIRENPEIVDQIDEHELPGILNWILEGIRLFKEEGLVPTESMKQTKERIMSDRDPLDNWLLLNLKDAPKAESISRKELWTAWQAYEAENGTEIFKKHVTFYSAIEQKGCKISKYSGDFVVLGKALRTKAEAKEYAKALEKAAEQKKQTKLF